MLKLVKDRMMVALAVALMAANLSATGGAGASSGTAPGLVLRDPAAVVAWSGSFEDTAGVSTPEAYAVPGSCTGPSCWEYTLDVDLPAGVWDAQAGGVQIAIDWFPHGISAGWADVYNWYLADQYVEVSGVPDGIYVLETVANPARSVHETTLDDNAARVAIRLEGDRVELVPTGANP